MQGEMHNNESATWLDWEEPGGQRRPVAQPGGPMVGFPTFRNKKNVQAKTEVPGTGVLEKQYKIQ